MVSDEFTVPLCAIHHQQTTHPAMSGCGGMSIRLIHLLWPRTCGDKALGRHFLVEIGPPSMPSDCATYTSLLMRVLAAFPLVNIQFRLLAATSQISKSLLGYM